MCKTILYNRQSKKVQMHVLVDRSRKPKKKRVDIENGSLLTFRIFTFVFLSIIGLCNTCKMRKTS